MAKWWENLPEAPVVRPSQPATRGLARVLEADDPNFLADQQAADDAEFARRHEAMSQSERALAQSDAQLRAVAPTVRGLYRTLTGDEAAGQQDLRSARTIMDREAAYAPDVQGLEDIHKPSDVAAYARNAVLSNLPTIVPTVGAAIATGGLSAAAGAGLRGLATEGIGAAAGRALTYKAGQGVGALAGSSALQSTQLLDAALDTKGGDSAKSRAAKAVVGAVTTGALDALPEISLLNRIGLGGAAKRAIAPEIAKTLRARMATEAGKQALMEGSTEAIQSLGENLTHKWVNDNTEVLGPKAYMDYLNSFVAGGLVGGAMGPLAGVRGGDTDNAQPSRDKARAEFRWFKQRDNTPRPAAEFDQPPIDKAKQKAADLGSTLKGAVDKAAAVDLGSTLKSATDTIKTEGSRAASAIGKLFGKHHAEFKDEDFNTDFDSMLQRFQAVDRNGEAHSEENGIIGRTHNDGVVRGGVPFNGFSLFNPDQAEAIWETGRKTGKPVSTFQAFALTAIDPTRIEGLGKEPIKAAALYLATGDRSAVNEDALADYMKSLPSEDSQMQFLFAADRISEMVKRGREAAGGPSEITPKDLRKMVGAKTDELRTNVDATDKENFDLQQELSDSPLDSMADYQQQRTMEEANLDPQPVALHETISAKDFSKMSFGDHTPDASKGEVQVTNSKGKPRTVKLASLVARGWQEVRNGTFTARNGVIDVVAQAIDTIRQKGMNISPDAIRPGLWLGGNTRLNAAQAKAIREGMQTTEAQRAPVLETPGLPNVPPGDRPFDASALEGSSEQVQGEDGVENMDGSEQLALRARTRSPLGLRVDVVDPGESAPPVMVAQKTDKTTGTIKQKFAPEKPLREAKVKVSEAETIDTIAADDISDDQRRAETDAITALHRANETIAPGTALKGKTLQQLMDNFGKRVAALKSPTKEQKTAIDGARRAIQRIERVTNSDEHTGPAFDPAQEIIDRQRQNGTDEDFADAQRLANGVPNELQSKPFTGKRTLVKKGSYFADLDFSVDDLIEDGKTLGNIGREQTMLHALTDRLGIERITLRTMPPGRSDFGSYFPSTRTIFLSAKRQGNARLDTLLHELGHAVVVDTYDQLSTEEQNALKDEYRAWLKEHATDKTELDARKSRAPFFLKKWLDENRGAGKSMADMTDEQIGYVLSFDEFLADHMSRALGKNAETQGIVGKFFSALADKLRELYQVFSGTKYEPAKSVEAWVDSLLHGQMARVINAQSVERQHKLIADNRWLDTDADELHAQLQREGFAASHDSPIRHEGVFNWREHALKGEGAMVFGAGTYLSTANGVHKSYKQQFTAQSNPNAGKIFDLEYELERIESNIEIIRHERQEWADDIQDHHDEVASQRQLLQSAADQLRDLGIDASDAMVLEDSFENDRENHKVYVEPRDAENSKNYHYQPYTEFVETTNNHIAKYHTEATAFAEKKVKELDAHIDTFRKQQEPLAAQLKQLKEAKSITDVSPTYQVSVNAKPDQIMDWDKPLNEQPDVLQKLRDASKKNVTTHPGRDFEWEKPSETDEYYSVVGVKSEDRPLLVAVDDRLNRWEITKKNGEYVVTVEDISSWSEGGKDVISRYNTLAEAKDITQRYTEDVLTDLFPPESVLPPKRKTGRQLYTALSTKLGSDRAASEYLQSLGLVGHRYAASGGRNDTHPNYVIYDDSRITTNAVKFDADISPPSTPPPIQPSQSNSSPAPSNLFYLLNKADRTRLENLLRDPKISEQVYRAATPEQQKQLDLYGNDMVTLVNLASALHAQGKLDISKGTPLDKLVRAAKTMLGLPDNVAVAKQIFADHAANQIARGRYDGEAKAFSRNDYTKTVLAVQRAMRNTVTPVYDKLTLDVGNRMRQSMVPALRKAATLFETRTSENAGEQSYVSNHQQFFSQHATDYMEAIGSLKDQDKRTLARALQMNQRPEDPALGPAFDRMRTFFNRLHSWANQHGVPIKFRRDYFPVVMDRKRIEDNWEGMASLFNKPEYEADIRSFFKDTKTPLPQLIDRMVQIAQTADASHVGEVEFALGIYEPSMNAQRAQIMGFLDKTDRAKLADFQVDSLDAITLGYVGQLAKKAAFVRTFGKVTTNDKGERQPNRLGLLRETAIRQGATKQDMQLFDDFAKMMLGSYHAELNPTIRWLFSKVDKVFDKNLEDMSIEEWAHYQQVAMTYNNFRLLGLAPLSSLIDSLGTLARGGNLTDATKSIWDGIRAFGKNDDLRQMAEQLGVVEKYAMSDALAATYGGQFDPQGKLGRLNNALFKYNGLEAITRHSRLAALAMGHRFLLRHALHPTKHSARLLKELQLTAADVHPDPAHPGFVQLTPKTEQALRRFVFESIVRPQPSQRPGWHNDPNFMFAAQYKGYLYSFYTTIVNRISHEAQQGNYSAAFVPLVPYLGVTVAAEMIRYAIQHPGEDDPRDADDYMRLAAIRSGLVGPRFGVFHDARTDSRYGSWMTNSWVGPTGQQAADLVAVATGKRSFGKTAIEALPGSAIFEDWTWGPSNHDDATAVTTK